MYSLILMTAVASSADSSNFHFRRGSCHGCCGGQVVQVMPAPVTYTLGCYGTPTYVVGGYSTHRGCCGGCWSSWNHTFYSGYSCCGGCCGGFSTIPAVVDCCGPVSVVTPSVATPTVTTPTVEKPANKDGNANIKIELPENALLYVDGQLVPGTGTVRTFTTPKLPGGKAFAYEMKAETVIDGSRIQEDLKVVVHAEDNLQKSFGQLLAAARRSKPTEVAKK